MLTAPRISDFEVEHSGPLATKQNYDAYPEESHLVWKTLYERQTRNLEDRAYTRWLDAFGRIGLAPDRLPRLTDIARALQPLTGWIPVPVSGFLSARDYFTYVAARQFPTVPSIRLMSSLEFIVEPDLFHDAFGHLPMHSDKAFAEFVALFGKVGLEVLGDEEKLTQLQRLYWFTVEYGLIRENGKIKIAGAGHLSGIKESQYSLTDDVEKCTFSLDSVIHQDFNPHILQKKLFVMESHEQACEALTELARRFSAS